VFTEEQNRANIPQARTLAQSRCHVIAGQSEDACVAVCHSIAPGLAEIRHYPTPNWAVGTEVAIVRNDSDLRAAPVHRLVPLDDVALHAGHSAE
jgi:hypothetical protein